MAASEESPPRRYLLRSDEDGPYLTSRVTPEVRVRLQLDYSVSGAAARKAPPGTIFLDGAAQGEPFLDHERRIFNLDHHEGVIRRFTLSACEQATVLVLRGLDLRERPWTIFANQPDLDTVLAIWVLLNSVHLREEEPALWRACMPLIRVEGLIDSQGLELMEFSGMGEERLQRTLDQIAELRRIESEARAEDGPERNAGTESLVALLEAIDRMVYPEGFFEPLPPVEELALEELSEGRIVVVCRCDCGIYEAEPVLKRLYGKRLAVIVLEREEGFFTLRQTDTFLPSNLEQVYRTLNLLDPTVSNSRAANRWGGSGEIGGSPRGSATRLRPAEIAAACRLAYRRPSFRERATAVGLSFLLASVPMAAGLIVLTLTMTSEPMLPAEWGVGLFGGVAIAVAAVLLLLLKATRHPGVFGLRWPVGWKWLWLIPAAVAAGLFGGTWPTELGPVSGTFRSATLIPILLLPLAAELTFRGLAQGLLMKRLPLAGSSGLFTLSWPTVAGAVLFAAWTLPLALYYRGFELDSPIRSAGVILAALLLGLVQGICREWSESLIGPILLHYLGSGAALLALWLA
ncbi:MAG: lysostaphin resistance A-like protein [Thermoanaerobaculia bacterium]